MLWINSKIEKKTIELGSKQIKSSQTLCLPQVSQIDHKKNYKMERNFQVIYREL